MESVLYFGARDHRSLWQVIDHQTAQPTGIRIISGHARGVDAVAEFTAHSAGREVRSHPARWQNEPGKKVNRAAGYDRNKVMHDVCDRAVGFLWPGCKGSLHTESLLKKSGKPYEMIEPNLRETCVLLYTSVHKSSRQGLPYKGPGTVDVSSRSFSSTWVQFAPSPSLLDSILKDRSAASRMSDEAERHEALDEAWQSYVPAYLQEQRDLYRHSPDAFLTVLRETNFAVATCYCPAHHPAETVYDANRSGEALPFDPANMQCHRRLLADIFVRVGKKHGIRVIDGGELNVAKINASRQSWSE